MREPVSPKVSTFQTYSTEFSDKTNEIMRLAEETKKLTWDFSLQASRFCFPPATLLGKTVWKFVIETLKRTSFEVYTHDQRGRDKCGARKRVIRGRIEGRKWRKKVCVWYKKPQFHWLTHFCPIISGATLGLFFFWFILCFIENE